MADGCTFVQHFVCWIASVAKDAFGIFRTNGVISTLFVSQKVRPFSYNVWTSGGRSTLSRSGRYKSNSLFVTAVSSRRREVLTIVSFDDTNWQNATGGCARCCKKRHIVSTLRDSAPFTGG